MELQEYQITMVDNKSFCTERELNWKKLSKNYQKMWNIIDIYCR